MVFLALLHSLTDSNDAKVRKIRVQIPWILQFPCCSRQLTDANEPKLRQIRPPVLVFSVSSGPLGLMSGVGMLLHQ